MRSGARPLIAPDVRAHLPQRRDNARHRTAAKLGAAIQHAGEWLSRHDTGHQADAGAGIDEIERRLRGLQGATAVNVQFVRCGAFYVHAERLNAAQGCFGVARRQPAAHL